MWWCKKPFYFLGYRCIIASATTTIAQVAALLDCHRAPWMASVSVPKRRKVETRGSASLASDTRTDVLRSSTDLPMQGDMANMHGVDYRAKKFAVAQAQQEGCLGNYRSFDSPHGNYLVPVIPAHSDLFRS